MKAKESLQYNGKVLLKERKKQKKNPKPMPTMEDFGFTAEEAS